MARISPDTLDNLAYDVPAETFARVISVPVYLRQVHRLQRKTSSWLDKPVPLPVQALMLALPPLTHEFLAPKLELRSPTPLEYGASVWASELPTPLRVRVLDRDTAPQYQVREGVRVLVVSKRFFTRPEAVQRRLVRAADRTDTTHTTATIVTQMTSMAIERVLWHAIVGERTKLSKRRALAFVGAEIARVTVVRRLRPALASKLDSSR